MSSGRLGYSLARGLVADARNLQYLQGLQHIKPALKLYLGSKISVLEKKRNFLLLLFTRGAGVLSCAYDELLLCGHMVQ